MTSLDATAGGPPPDESGAAAFDAVAQLRTDAGEVAGAGFLVERDVLITCAHVVEAAGYGPGETMRLVFPGLGSTADGEILTDPWRGSGAEDVAVIRLDATPAGAKPLPVGVAAGCRAHRVRSFGFPPQGRRGGQFGYGTAGDLLTADGAEGPLLQLTDANDLAKGFSGGPVVDEVTGLVIGMVNSLVDPDPHLRGQDVAFATPAESLRQIWPGLTVRDVHPYRGLEPFTEKDHRWFHGRADDIERILEKLAGQHRVLLLLGPSGSGKSSLVRAGLLPALAAGRLPGADRWLPVVVRPGQDLAAELEQGGLSGPSVSDAVRRRLAAEPGHDGLLLVVDQLEELFTQPGSAPVAALAQLSDAVESCSALRTVLVMRDDFYPHLAAQAPQLLEERNLFNLPATLGDAALRAIIREPARTAGARFADGLPERIIGDIVAAERHGAVSRRASTTLLPALQVALSNLWDRRDAAGFLTHDAYERIGKVTGSISTWCGTAVENLSADERRMARGILTALVRPADPDHDIPAVRQRLRISDLRERVVPGSAGDDPQDQQFDDVLDALRRHRIIATANTGEAGGGSPVPRAELIHDAVIRDWAVLRDWAAQEQPYQDWLLRTSEREALWDRRRNPDDLLGGTALAEGLEWQQRRPLPTSVAAFVRDSQRHQRARAQRSRRLNLVLAVALALAVVAAGTAVWQRQRALSAGRASLSRQLAAQSDLLADTDPDLASLLAVQAYRSSPTAEARTSLYDAAGSPLRYRLAGHTGGIGTLAFSPDGRTLATGSDDRTVKLWDTATGRPRAALTGHTGRVVAAAFSPDGRTLATTSTDHTARLWDTATGRPRAVLTGHAGAVGPLAFSPDGRVLATGSDDHTVRLWDVAGGRATAVLTGHGSDVSALAFSAHGDSLASGSWDGTVRLWDPATHRSVHTLVGHSQPVLSVAFRPDGRSLASCGLDGTVRLWDTSTGQAAGTVSGSVSMLGLATTTAGTRAIRPGAAMVAFSPDGGTLVTGTDDGTVNLWDLASGTKRYALTGHSGLVWQIVFSPDGATLATGGVDGTTRLWDVATGRSEAVLAGHTGAVWSVAFSRDGRTLATGSDDHTARLWNVGTSRTLTGQKVLVWSMAFSPDSRTVVTNDEDTARLWDVATGHLRSSLTSGQQTVVFSPDGSLLATSDGDRTWLWDVATGHRRFTFLGHAETYAFSPDGHTLAVLGAGGEVRLWDVATGRRTTILSSHTVGTSHSSPSMAFSPDGRQIAGTFARTTWLWDVATGRGRRLSDTPNEVRAVLFSPDSRALAACDDKTTALYDAATGRRRALVKGRLDTESSKNFSPDSRVLATSDEQTVRLWNVATGKLRATLTGHTDFVESLAFSPDSHLLATASQDRTARLWDVATGRVRSVLTGHTGDVDSLAFSPDGATLATSGSDDTARIWDVATGRVRSVLTGHTNRVGQVLFSPDGRTLATSSDDNTVRLWDESLPDPAEAISRICRAVRRDLSAKERSTYLPGRHIGVVCPA